MIPITDTPKPFYNAAGPLGPDAVFLKQSAKPLNTFWLPWPTSDASLVLA